MLGRSVSSVRGMCHLRKVYPKFTDRWGKGNSQILALPVLDMKRCGCRKEIFWKIPVRVIDADK